MAEDCVTDVIATPHQLGRFSDCNEASQIREQVAILNEELVRNGISLHVVPGADVRVDERICQLIEEDKVLTLADGKRYILLELPHEVFIDIEPLLVELSSLGIQAIISHPERHRIVARQPSVLLKWLEQSAHLQLTSASLLGDFGTTAQKAAWHFLTSGWASLVATDSHDLQSRRPCMSAAFEDICDILGEATAHLLCVENPSRVLEGKDIFSASFVSTGDCTDERVPSGP